MADIRTLIAQTSDNHIIRGMPDEYVSRFVQAATAVYPPHQLEAVLQQKFHIPDDSTFALDSYFQSASELSVQFHLASDPVVKSFGIDKQVNPPKDVEAYYEVNGVRVSLEVKCPVEKDAPKDLISLRTAGRIPDHRDRYAELEGLLQEAAPSRSVQLAQNKDNTLKDFLVSAHSKFAPGSGVCDLNVLTIACEGRSNMNDWFLYLTGAKGLFTADPFVPASTFELVDVVMLSNLKYCHKHAPAHHDWTLRNVLLIPVLNPAPRKSLLSSAVIRGLEVFEHHMKTFGEYRRTAEPGVPDDVLNAVKLIGFVSEALSDEHRRRYFSVGVDA